MSNRGGYRKHIRKHPRNVTRPLPTISDSPGLLYGLVNKRFGPAFSVLCSNGKEVRALVRGKMKNRTWINVNDYVLIDTSEINTFYIVIKLSPDEVRQLKIKGEINFDSKYNNDSIMFEGEKKDDSDDDADILEELSKNNKNDIINLTKSKSFNDNGITKSNNILSSEKILNFDSDSEPSTTKTKDENRFNKPVKEKSHKPPKSNPTLDSEDSDIIENPLKGKSTKLVKPTKPTKPIQDSEDSDIIETLVKAKSPKPTKSIKLTQDNEDSDIIETPVKGKSTKPTKSITKSDGESNTSDTSDNEANNDDSSDPEITAEMRQQQKIDRNKHDASLINEAKLSNKFKNKGHGGKNIVRERGRAAARAKKRRV